MMVDLHKSLSSKVTFKRDDSGNLCQETTIYESETHSQRVCVFKTRHSVVSVTRSGLHIRFLFNRKKNNGFDLENFLYDESNQITDWLSSDGASKIISKAEEGLL